MDFTGINSSSKNLSNSLHSSDFNNNSQSQQGVFDGSNSSILKKNLEDIIKDIFDKYLKAKIKQHYFSHNEKFTDYLSTEKKELGKKLLDECALLLFQCLYEYCYQWIKELHPIKPNELHGDIWMNLTVRELFMYCNNTDLTHIEDFNCFDMKCSDLYETIYLRIIILKLKEINKE